MIRPPQHYLYVRHEAHPALSRGLDLPEDYLYRLDVRARPSHKSLYSNWTRARIARAKARNQRRRQR